MRGQPKVFGLLIGIVASAIVFLSPSVGATSVNWVEVEPLYSGKVNAPTQKPLCEYRKLMVDGLKERGGDPYEANVCYHDFGSWGYGRYSYYQNVFNHGNGDAIRFEPEGLMYRINSDLSSNGYAQIIDVPDSDDVVRLHQGQIWYYRDFPSKFDRLPSTGSGVTYSFNKQDFDLHLSRPDGTAILTNGFTLSNNGKWAVAEARGLGLIRINLVTFTIKRFSTINIDYSYSRWPGPRADMAVSDDGQNAVIAGWNAGEYEVFDIKNDCGDEVGDDTSTETPIDTPCSSRNLRELVTDNYAMRQEFIYNPQFSDSGGKLVLELGSTNGTNAPPREWVEFTAGNYQPEKKITYLALGDSYSSGEGDIGKKENGSSYYLPGTDSDEECHISSRSYPFLLREAWSIESGDMKSVSCSSARMLPDYFGGDDYLGQRRQMENWGEARRSDTRKRALDNFSPGIVGQVEFIEEYQPKKVTFTGGGNDIGFADILEYCASSYRLFGLLPTNERCAYATNSQLRANLNRQIDDQYDYSKLFVKKLQEVSPATEIYMVGYPQFVASPGWSCFKPTVVLDQKERTMIRESVSRLNNILKEVALDTGVHYVDVEDSLDRGQICQGSEYMTGPLKVIARNHSFKKDANMYHPNAAGHKKIAEAIDLQFRNGFDSEITDVLRETNGQRVVKRSVLASFLDIGSSHTIKILSGVFKIKSGVVINMYSELTSLGTAETSKDDGSLEIEVTIPSDMSIGRHLITLTGVDPSGEPVQVQQFVYVTSDISGDIDGDGILDSDDKCNFIAEWYIDNKNVCSTKDAAAYIPVATDNHYETGYHIESRYDDRLNSEKLALIDASSDTVGTMSNNGQADEKLKNNQANVTQDSADIHDSQIEKRDMTLAVAIIILILLGLGGIIYVIKKRQI